MFEQSSHLKRKSDLLFTEIIYTRRFLYLVSCIFKFKSFYMTWLSSGALNQYNIVLLYNDLTVIGIWSIRLFVSAGLLLLWTVGWSGMKDRKLSSFVLNGITKFDIGRAVSLMSYGRRLNSLAPLTGRLGSLAFLT